MNEICDDNDFWYIIRNSGLIYSTSDSKKFGFCAHNIHSIIECFNNRFVVDINIRDRSNGVILNTSIHDDKSMQWSSRWFNSQIIQSLNSRFMAIVAFANWMEREMVREKINDSTTRRNSITVISYIILTLSFKIENKNEKENKNK